MAPYRRIGEHTRSANRPPATLPIAIPPKNPVRIVATAWVVFPNTRTSCLDQTTSYMSPAAPDRTKIARRSRGWRTTGVSHASGRSGPIGNEPRRLQVVGPVPAEESDEDPEHDQPPRANADRGTPDPEELVPSRVTCRRHAAERPDERDRVE